MNVEAAGSLLASFALVLTAFGGLLQVRTKRARLNDKDLRVQRGRLLEQVQVYDEHVIRLEHHLNAAGGTIPQRPQKAHLEWGWDDDDTNR